MEIDRNVFFRLIGAKVAYYRKIRNLTQEELSRNSNISVSVLRKIEQGRYNDNIPLASLIDISQGLSVEVYLLIKFNNMEKDLLNKDSDEEDLY